MAQRPRLWTELPALLAACWMLWAFLAQVNGRIGYPFDLEWMEGGMLLHAQRVQEGLPLYVLPSAEFIPFIYPPLYAWIVGLLSKVAGLSYLVGRSVSVVGTLAASGALVAAVRLERGSWFIGAAAGALFLSCYDETGAFFDLVRIDGLMVGLWAWSLVAARAGWLRTAGLLLVGAFMTKHNAAAFGLPILWWVWRTDGVRPALQFVLWSVVPALAFVGLMQVQSDGLFLTYLLEVPAHHGGVPQRGFPGMPVELVRALPLGCLLALTGVVLCGTRSWRVTLSAVGGLLAWVVLSSEVMSRTGMVGALESQVGSLWGAHSPLGRFVMAFLEPADHLLFTLGLLPLVALLGWAAWRSEWTSAGAYWMGHAVLGIVLAGAMRAHVGGFTNVLIPALWLVSFMVVFAALSVARRIRQPWGSLVISLVLAAQVVQGRWDRAPLTPTDADEKAGWALVDQLRMVDGDILAPQHPYYPVLAGKRPSFALIAYWDIDKVGPLHTYTDAIDATLEDGTWSAVLESSRPLKLPVSDHYVVDRTFLPPPWGTLKPKTGWPVRPHRLHRFNRD